MRNLNCILFILIVTLPLWGQEPGTATGLKDVYRQALQNNESVGISQERYLQQEYLRKQVTSALLPDISLEGSYFQQEDISSEGFAGQSFLLSTRKTLWAHVEQNLFKGLREKHGLDQTKAQIKAGKENIRRVKDELLVEVAFAFYQSLKTQREVETIEESLRLQEERLREVTARQKIGLARRTDVLLSETQVANDQSTLIRVKNDLEIALERLNFIVGAPVSGPLADDIAEIVSPMDFSELLRTAMAQRPDVKEAAYLVEAAKINVKVVRGEYLPELEFSGNYYGYREGIQSPVDWDVQVSLSIPFFWGTDVRGRELQAISRQREFDLNRQRLERLVELEVKSAALEWKTSDALIASLQKEMEVAAENYRLIQEEYRIGIATNLEVLASFNSLESAKLDLEKEKINRKFAWIRLQKAIGENPVLME